MPPWPLLCEIQKHEGPQQTNQLDQFHPALDLKISVSSYYLLSEREKNNSQTIKRIDTESSIGRCNNKRNNRWRLQPE